MDRRDFTGYRQRPAAPRRIAEAPLRALGAMDGLPPADAAPAVPPALLSEEEITRALKAGEFHLCYQPKLHLRGRHIDGMEALARWDHPSWGRIPPEQFIAAMERHKQIGPFTLWALGRALADQAETGALGHPLAVAVNISGQLLADSRFTAALLGLRSSLRGSLTLEITETAVIENPAVAFANLDRIVQAGFSVAIDDYGAGLSSLAYLRRLPARELKIDKMFVIGMTRSNRDPLLVRSTIDLAHALGMVVTAEGVEDLPTLELLRVMGCDHAQGYVVARPMRIERMQAMLADGGKLEHLTGGAPLLGAADPGW